MMKRIKEFFTGLVYLPIALFLSILYSLMLTQMEFSRKKDARIKEHEKNKGRNPNI